MKRKYHVVESRSTQAGEVIRSFCAANGPILAPSVGLIAEARLAVDEVIGQAGRGSIETILHVSAEQVAGAKTPGRSSSEVRWHGRQQGRVQVAGSEAGTAMFEALLKGVSTRDYAAVIRVWLTVWLTASGCRGRQSAAGR